MLLKKFQLPLMISTDEFARRVQEFLVTNPMRRPAGSKKMDYMVMEGDARSQYEIFRSEPQQRYIIASTSFATQNGLPVLVVQPRIAGRAWLGPLLFTSIAITG